MNSYFLLTSGFLTQNKIITNLMELLENTTEKGEEEDQKKKIYIYI